MALPPIQDGEAPLEVWGSPLCCLLKGDNILCGHIRLALRVCSGKPPDGPCQGTGHVPVMVRLADEGILLVNQPYRLFRHPLGSECAGGWWGGAYIAPSDILTWCPQGLVVLWGVGSNGRCVILLGISHVRDLVSAIAVHIVKSDWIQNSLDTLSPLSQTAGGTAQGCSLSVNATIFPVRPSTTSSCGGRAAAA